ncbi:MAG TPA: SDR family oxidoreductase [Thermoleophilia bacterium]|nr:SDR family oxidoreductase [Thermoleophilia bacterium]
MELSGTSVIVTGASSGIGEAFARLAAREGARLVLAARRTARLEALAAELPDAMVVTTDLRVPEQVDAMVAAAAERHGGVDILVNNAGQGLHVPVEEVGLDDLQAVVELNLYAPLLAMQAVVPLMRSRGGGAIVNVSSNTTRMTIPGVGAYSATKSALNQLSATARAEWAGDGIAVSLVFPSVTATEFHRSLRAGSFRGGGHVQAHPPELVAEAIRRAIETGDAEVFPVPPAS